MKKVRNYTIASLFILGTVVSIAQSGGGLWQETNRVYERSCGEGFSFNLGFVRHTPRAIVTVTYRNQLTGEERTETFKEDCGDAWEWFWE